MDRIFLVDGNSYVYRAFFATPYLSNSKGMPTNAIYAFISMIRKLINEQKPDRLVVVWDSKVPSFRMQISREYKATRPPMPGNLSLQFPYVKTIVEKMGIAVIEKEGFEADDVIATLVQRLAREDVEVFVVTSDKDIMQLATDSVTIVDTMKNLVMKRAEVAEKFGIDPVLIPDFLALSGDPSDNIPGVPGIGEKTARQLVSEYGGLDDIYARLDDIKKPSLRRKLEENRDRALMSKELATLRFDVPLDMDMEGMRIREPDLTELRRIFRELEFTSLSREIRVDEGKTAHREAASLGEALGETISVVARIQGRCPADVSLKGFAVSNNDAVFYSEKADDLFSALSAPREVIVHDLKPIYIAADRRGIGLHPAFFDTMLAVYLINPARKDYALEGVIAEFLDRDISGDGEGRSLAEGAFHLAELKDVLLARLDELGLHDLFFTIELPLVEVLAHMECLGVRVNRSALAALSRDFDARLNAVITRIYDTAGETFNINSPQQLVRILFHRFNLPVVKKTKTSLSTDNEVLQTLSDLHPLPAQILEYRMLAKLKSTYVDSLHTLIHQTTGRIHAAFNQMVVATGRLSSSDPNLQNIPIKGVEGKKIREAFVPEEGFLFLSSDYSQIELRVLAHLSGDELLIETFRNDGDIHSRVAQEVFKVDADHVTPAMRRTAKVINFGIVYGISGYGLSKELGVGPREAQVYIDAYFERHRGISAYIERTLTEARKNGFVRTLFGRIRYIPELSNADMNVRQFGERTAMNTPVQGTAADIIKMAMVSIYRKVKERGLRSRLIMQIHDELVFEVAEAEAEEMEQIVTFEMEHACPLLVPLKVTIGKGRNWAEAHD
ncbi:MAG: DNA polymerase I [Syntrophorhabdales bacterium]|jgi:DNA polymerase-1